MSPLFLEKFKYLILFLGVFFSLSMVKAQKVVGKDFYQIKIYHLQSHIQETRLEAYLQNAYIPALHNLGIHAVGVFKPVSDTNTHTDFAKEIYLLTPFADINTFLHLDDKLGKDKVYLSAAKSYMDTPYDSISYQRFESILLSAFPGHPQYKLPAHNNTKRQRIYELRSYEGPTERYYENKVAMFNEGNEINIFKRLDFNAVFYATVISGSHMPNLMYMTTFEDRADREKHWEAFSNDPEWKHLSALPRYAHNVSHADILFLYPTDYSDF